MFVGSWLSGAVVEHNSVTGVGQAVVYHWRAIWLFPAIMSGVILVLFLVTFNDRSKVVVRSDDGLAAEPVI